MTYHFCIVVISFQDLFMQYTHLIIAEFWFSNISSLDRSQNNYSGSYAHLSVSIGVVIRYQ